jgi:hypothetical protein
MRSQRVTGSRLGRPCRRRRTVRAGLSRSFLAGSPQRRHPPAAGRGRLAVLPAAWPGTRGNEGSDQRGGHGRLPAGRAGTARWHAGVGLRVQVMSVLRGISPVWVSEGGLERPDRWYIPESGIHHQPKLPRQGPPGSAFRRRIAAAPPGPHDRFGYLTCGNDDRGQPGSSREVIRELRDAGQPWAGRRLGLCRQEMPCQLR